MLAVAVCAPGRMRARWAVAVAGGVAAEAVMAAAAAAAAVVLAAAVAVAAEPNEYYSLDLFLVTPYIPKVAPVLELELPQLESAIFR